MGDQAVLAIVGPTASGKSRVAVQVAAARTRTGLPTEIVAVDAFTVYRGMNIGTAKPSDGDATRVRHHLVDILDPTEQLTVAHFQRLARAAIDDILRRQVTPLLVGGSGLYWRAVVDDLEFPPTDPGVRAAIEQRWRHDRDAAHEHLAAIDPQAAATIQPGNLRRVVRALEVHELTGRPFSTYRTALDRFDAIYRGLDASMIDPPDAALKAAIVQRAHQMVAQGLVDEADQLRSMALSSTAQAAIGYAEAFAVLDGQMTIDELGSAIAARTWKYARRQRSWFRKDPRLVVRDPAATIAHLTVPAGE